MAKFRLAESGSVPIEAKPAIADEARLGNTCFSAPSLEIAKHSKTAPHNSRLLITTKNERRNLFNSASQSM